MDDTQYILGRAAYILDVLGLHTGDQFAASDSRALDVCAAVYIAAERNTRREFFTDECASLALIESSEPAMAAIRAISEALDTEPCETNGAPDYIEHVSNWAATPPIGETSPPSTSEVIGRILRAAANPQPTTGQNAA